MPPRTIVVNPTAPGPSLSFVMPAGVELSVESMFAAIDASGAGDVTAMLEVADSSGQVIARKRQGEVVSAGSNPGSATWALRLTDDRAAVAGSAAAWAQVTRLTTQGSLSGSVSRLVWTQFITSDPTVFSTLPGGVSGDTLLHYVKPGLYLFLSLAGWVAVANGPKRIRMTFTGTAALSTFAGSLANTFLNNNAVFQPAYAHADAAMVALNTTSAPGSVALDALQSSGLGQTISAGAEISAYYWPSKDGVVVY